MSLGASWEGLRASLGGHGANRDGLGASWKAPRGDGQTKTKTNTEKETKTRVNKRDKNQIEKGT